MQPIHERLFQIGFQQAMRLRQAGKLQNNRVFNQVGRLKNLIALFRQLQQSGFTARKGKPLIQQGSNLPLQFPRRPVRFDTFRLIKSPRFRLFNASKQAVMCPTQFGTHCVPNWESVIKFTHVTQITNNEAFSEFLRQTGGKFFEKVGSILGFGFSALFYLNNLAPNLSIRAYHLDIDRLQRLMTPALQNVPKSDQSCYRVWISLT